MKTEIILKAKQVTKFGISYPITEIKNGNKFIARICPPNETRKEFQIEYCSLAFYRPTIQEALELVRSKVEDRFNAFGDTYAFDDTYQYSVKIKEI